MCNDYMGDIRLKKLILRFDFGDGKIEGPIVYHGCVVSQDEFLTTEGDRFRLDWDLLNLNLEALPIIVKVIG